MRRHVDVDGDIARAMGARQNTLSSNLRILSSAGLISARRVMRSARRWIVSTQSK